MTCFRRKRDADFCIFKGRLGHPGNWACAGAGAVHAWSQRNCVGTGWLSGEDVGREPGFSSARCCEFITNMVGSVAPSQPVQEALRRTCIARIPAHLSRHLCPGPGLSSLCAPAPSSRAAPCSGPSWTPAAPPQGRAGHLNTPAEVIKMER